MARDNVVVEQRQEECVCPKCGGTAKAHNKLETRLLHGLECDYAVMYSIMVCPCGYSFASYDESAYPPNDAYMPEVKENVRFLRFKKRLSWTEIKKRVKDIGLDIALNTIRNWCKEK